MSELEPETHSLHEALKEGLDRKLAVAGGHIQWGHWRYEPETLCLVFKKDHVEYDVSLRACTTPQEAFRWIDHVSRKAWLTEEELGHFVRALSEVVGRLNDQKVEASEK